MERATSVHAWSDSAVLTRASGGTRPSKSRLQTRCGPSGNSLSLAFLLSGLFWSSCSPGAISATSMQTASTGAPPALDGATRSEERGALDRRLEGGVSPGRTGGPGWAQLRSSSHTATSSLTLEPPSELNGCPRGADSMASASAPSASSWPCGASRPRAAPPPPSRRQLNNCAQFEMQPASNGFGRNTHSPRTCRGRGGGVHKVQDQRGQEGGRRRALCARACRREGRGTHDCSSARAPTGKHSSPMAQQGMMAWQLTFS